MWPWIDHKKGEVVTVQPKSKARKSTSAGRFKKSVKEKVKLDKLKRVQQNRKVAVEGMGEAFLRDQF